MPLKRMLVGGAFDSKTVALLLEAFDQVVAVLDLQTVADKERAAKTIIGFASRQTDLDAAKLRDSVVALMRTSDP